MVDHRGTEAVDVHGAPAGEMQQPLAQLRRTHGVRAARHDLALGSVNRRLAHRAAIRHDECFAVRRTLVEDHVDDLWNDVAGSLDPHGIADTDAFAVDFVLVVQGSSPNRDAGDVHGVEHGGGSQRPGAAHVEGDVLYHGNRLLRRELEGDGPAGMMRGGPEGRLQRQVIDLHDDPVGLVIQLVTLGFELLAIVNDVVQGATARPVEIYPRAGLLKRLQRVPVRRDGVGGLGVAQGVEENIQRPASSDAGIQQPQRAGGGVARVGEGRLSIRFELPVEARKGAPRHVDLAANFQAVQARQFAVQTQGNALDGAQVLRDVLTHPAVAACRAAHEFAVFVEQCHAQAVDFRLDHVAQGLRRLVPAAASGALRTPAVHRRCGHCPG